MAHSQPDRIKEGAAAHLPLTCFHWGTYRVLCRNGQIADLLPFEQDRDPSPIGRGILDLINGPLRIRKPAVRRSWLEGGAGKRGELRGSDSFIEVSWAEAERLVAGELNRVRANFGNEAIYAGSYGWGSAGRFHHAQSQLKRFLNCIGGFTSSVNSYSFAAAEVVMPHIVGNFHKILDDTTSWPAIAENTELFVAFGGIPLRNSQIGSGGVGCHTASAGLSSAVDAGVKFVNVSPMRADMPQEADHQWLPIRPGTDTALLLAIASTLLSMNLHNQKFLDRYTVGSERFFSYLAGRCDGIAKTPEWAAKICGIGAQDIRRLALRMASSRTILSAAWSLTRQSHGEQAYWAIVAVAAMLGQIGLGGGGFGFGYAAVNSIGAHYSVLPAKSFPQRINPVKTFVPVARISDMLLNPGGHFDYDGSRYRYPDIDLVYWAGGNPFHHHQDLNRLQRAWAKPSTIIVNDWSWNSLARRADIVLPCTTPLERSDFAVSRDPFVISMSCALKPVGESQNDFDIFRALAERLGVQPDFDEGKTESQWQALMYGETRRRAVARNLQLPDYETFRQRGWIRLETPVRPRVLLKAFREDPDRKPLRTPSGRIEIHSRHVESFGYRDCPGLPIWIEPAEWLGSPDCGSRLHLISHQPASRLHSQLDPGSISMASKPGGREPVFLNPVDASERGIMDQDAVMLWNQRGRCLAVAQLDSRLRPGVCAMATGSWFDPCLHESAMMCRNGNPNILTLDIGTSRLAQGPVAHTCLVDVKLFEGKLPSVEVYNPPAIDRGRSDPRD